MTTGMDWLMGPSEDETHTDHSPDTSSGEYKKIAAKHLSQLIAIPPVVADGSVISRNGSLLFNYRRPDGTRFTVERPDVPPLDPQTGKPVYKYKHPPGGRGLNVHPLVHDHMIDTGAPLIVVEGTKQYLAVVGATLGKRLFPVGISGIRNWQWKPGGEGQPSIPLPDWGYIPIIGRAAYVIPDGDYDTNQDVRDGADSLMDYLRAVGASEVHRVKIPLVADSKTGADDWLATVPSDARQGALLRALEESEDDQDEFFITRERLSTLPPVEPLIDGMINKASITWLSGKFGTYKTFVALSWACCVATGKPWEGHQVRDTGPVIYVAAEGHRGLLGRTEAWEHGLNRGQQVDGLIVTPGGLDPRDKKCLAKLIRQIHRVGAKMVVFDTLHRCAPGLEENSSKDFSDVMDGLQRIVHETEASVIMLAHTGHSGERARGSSAQEDSADDAYVIKLAGDPEDRSVSNTRVLVRRKSKEGEAGEEYNLRLVMIPGEDPWDPRAGSKAYVTLEPDGSLPEVPTRVRSESPVQRIIREMDEAGLPVDLSQRAAAGWLEAREIEIRGRATDWRTAHSARKQRADMQAEAARTDQAPPPEFES